MGCFVFTAHRHIWGPPTEFQDMELWPQGQRQEGNVRPLSPALGTKMWLVLFLVLHVGIPGITGY